MKCRICQNPSNNAVFKVQEMMFGFRDQFTYFQCSKCGCLQISEIPKDMSKYYPENYYSFNYYKVKNPVVNILKKMRNRYAVFNKGVIGKLIYEKYPHEMLRSLSAIEITKHLKILDVGCGYGSHLLYLKEIGFKNLSGIDPYIKNDISYPNGLRILKMSLTDIKGEWDLIMFHHSLEHIPDQIETMQLVQELLSKDGICLIRIPIVSSYAWEHFGVNWIQIDAPRHYYLHSIESLESLANRAILIVKKIIFDSSDLQFWGSIQYSKNIPRRADRSYSMNPSNSIFSSQEIAMFRRKARILNSENRGDQAAFYLMKK